MDLFENLALTVAKLPVEILPLKLPYVADPPDVVPNPIILFIFPI